MKNITLSIDEDILQAGREYARVHDMSFNVLVRKLIEQTVEEYLENIAMNRDSDTFSNTIKSPITDSISGMFHENGKSYKDMLEEALQEKYL